MSFPRYPKYKESGVEWLGQVPEHWEVKRARAIGVFSSSGIDKKLVEGEQSVQMFNYLDVYKSTDKILRYSDELMWTTAPREKVVEHAVVDGDILLTPSSETGDDIGHAARLTNIPENVVYSYHLVRFRKCVPSDPSYLTYSFNASLIRSYFESVCTGTTRMVLVREDFKNTPIALPPLDEQTAIADFLDRETAKIDGLIAEQERLIELLREKRQAVISHAVTKGLNPDAPMKDSGIEWLGQVPEHWICLQLGKVCKSVADGPHYSPDYVDEGVPFLSARNVKVDCWSLDDAKYISEADCDDFDRRVIPQINDVLYTKGGTTGIARVVDLEFRFQVWVHLAVLKIHKEKVDPYFLAYALNGIGSYEQAQLLTRGATNNDLGLTRMIKIWFALPTIAEQREIVESLDNHIAQLDALTVQVQRAITLLQERRSALISAAVTGQIDVRTILQKAA